MTAACDFTRLGKVLVTGHRGFIGSHLFDTLVSNNVDVEGIDLRDGPGSDLTDKSVVEALGAFDTIFHLAAYNGTKHFYTKPFQVAYNNTLPTLNLVEKYSEDTVRFVFASTCEIFNSYTNTHPEAVPTREDVPVMFTDIGNPRWSYSLPKALGENLVLANMKAPVVARFFNIYGPRQQDHFIDEFVRRGRDTGVWELYGNDTRSFCFISDAIDALIGLANSQSAVGQIFNVGNDCETSIDSVAKLIMKKMGVEENLLSIKDGRRGSAIRRSPDISKLGSMIGWEPRVELDEGLDKVLVGIIL